jgi:hypothetical protein
MNEQRTAPLPPPIPDGFIGVRAAVLGSASEAGHTLTLALYRFPGGELVPYLEITEAHPWYSGSRLVPVSGAVHALLNLGDMEIYQVGNREEDWQGIGTVPAKTPPETE